MSTTHDPPFYSDHGRNATAARERHDHADRIHTLAHAITNHGTPITPDVLERLLDETHLTLKPSR